MVVLSNILKFTNVPVGARFKVYMETYRKMGKKEPVVKRGDGTVYTKVSATVSTDDNGRDAIFSFNDKVILV